MELKTLGLPKWYVTELIEVLLKKLSWHFKVFVWHPFNLQQNT